MSLWHLTGQIYCALCRAPLEVDEKTLLDETVFLAALKVNEGLRKAYRRSTQSNRATIRALLGAMSPFDMSVILQEDVTLPEVAQLGPVEPRTLHNLCEMYSPEVVEQHIRHAYSREGYARALSLQKIERIPMLETQVFGLVETETQLVEAHTRVSGEIMHTVIKQIQDKFAHMKTIPTAKEVLIQKDVLQQQAELITRRADQERVDMKTKGEKTRREKENLIFKTKREMDRIRFETERDIARVGTKLDIALVALQQELKTAVGRYDLAKFKDRIVGHQNFLSYIKTESVYIARALGEQMGSDIKQFLSDEQIIRMLPIVKAEEREVDRWLKNTLYPTIGFEPPHENDPQPFEKWKHVRPQLLKLIAEIGRNGNVLRDEVGIADVDATRPTNRPDFISLSYNAATAEKVLSIDVDPARLPNPEAYIGVSAGFETVDDAFVFHHLRERKNRDPRKAAWGMIETYLQHYLDEKIEAFRAVNWTYYVKLTATNVETNAYAAEFIRLYEAYEQTDLLPEFKRLPAIETALKGQGLDVTFIEGGIQMSPPREIKESKQTRGVDRLEEGLTAIVGTAVLAAAAGGGLYFLVKKVKQIVTWFISGEARLWFAKTLFAWVDQMAKGHKYAYQKWYLDALAANDFDAIQSAYLAQVRFDTAEGVASYIGTDSGFTVANAISKVPMYTWGAVTPPIPSKLRELELVKKGARLEQGWKLEILYFVGLNDFWVVRRAVAMPGEHRKALETVDYYYYQLDNLQFLHAIGAQEGSFRAAVKQQYKSIFHDAKTVKQLAGIFAAAGDTDSAKDIAQESGIPWDEIQAMLKEDADGAPATLLEEEEPETPSPPAVGGGKTKPTEYIPPTEQTEIEQPKPGDIQTPDGTVISKEQAKQMVGKMLHNIGDQMLQGGGADVKPPEGEGEEPAEEEAPEATPTPAEPLAPTEEPEEEEAPEEEPTEEPEAEEKPAEPEKPEETPPKEEEPPAEEEEEDEKKKKKVESVAREINFRRLIGLRKELRGSPETKPTLKESLLTNLAFISRRTSDHTTTTSAVNELRRVNTHPLMLSLLESDLVLQALASGDKRAAVRQALTLPESLSHAPKAVGLALGMVNARSSLGDLLFEAEDLEDVEAMVAAAPPEPEPIEMSPEEFEAEEVMVGTETVMNQDKMASTVATLAPEDELSGMKEILLGDEIMNSYLESGDTEGALSRAEKLFPQTPQEDIVVVVSEIQGHVPTGPVSAETVADRVAGDLEMDPQPELEITLPGDVAPTTFYPGEIVPEIETPVSGPVMPSEVVAPIEAPPEVETNYGVPETAADNTYEGILLKVRGSICEVATREGRVKLPTNRLRVLPSGTGLDTCLMEMNRGTPVATIAKRRLYNRVFAVPATKLKHPRLSENARYLVLYLMEKTTTDVVSYYGGYTTEGVGIVPLEGLNEARRRHLIRDLGSVRSYTICSRTALRLNPHRPLCEQLEVPEGNEGNEAAVAFEDAMKALQVAQQSFIDFEGQAGKIKSLVSLGKGGKKTANALEKLGDEVKEALTELKDVMEKFSEAHDTFTTEFPEAKATEAPPPTEPSPEIEELPVEEPPTPEAPPAEPEPTEEAPPTEPVPTEEKAEEVAERLMSRYKLEDFVRRSHRGKIGRLVLQEESSMTPQEVEQTVNLLIERLKY